MSEPLSVAGKRIVITGGTSGIGLAVAEHLVASGARVVITGRRSGGDRVAADVGASFVPMDVTDDASVRDGMERAVEHLGGLDVAILNAGIDLPIGMLEEVDLDAFRTVIDVNLVGVVRGLRFSLPHMSDGGSVIVTSSPAAHVTTAGVAAYSSSKAAVDSIVRTAAIELGPRGIRVNGVRPGIVESEMSGGSTGDGGLITMLTVGGTFRAAAEIAPVYRFLASDASRLLTGGVVDADDGIGAGLSVALVTRAMGDGTPPA